MTMKPKQKVCSLLTILIMGEIILILPNVLHIPLCRAICLNRGWDEISLMCLNRTRETGFDLLGDRIECTSI